jgi:hypothetical protein
MFERGKHRDLCNVTKSNHGVANASSPILHLSLDSLRMRAMSVNFRRLMAGPV